MCRTVLRFVTDCQELDSNFCVSLNCDFVSLGERCIYICIYTTRGERKKKERWRNMQGFLWLWNWNILAYITSVLTSGG